MILKTHANQIMDAQPKALSAQRLDYLDGLRGLAVLMVFVHHFVVFDLPSAHGLKLITSFCRSGVDLFFVLSGFLIGGILIDNYRAKNFLTVFFCRRAYRIVPLYYGFLLINMIWSEWFRPYPMFMEYHNPFFFMGWYFIGFQNWLMALHNAWALDTFTHTWSLAIEDQFYFVTPFLFLLFPLRKLFWLMLGIVIALPLIRCGIFFLYDDVGFRVGVLTPFRIDTILAGVLCAVIIRFEGIHRLKYLYIGLFTFWLVLFCALCVLIGRYDHSDSWTYGYSVVAWFSAVSILLIYFKPDGFFGRFFSWSLLRKFGKYSYFIYLFSGILSQIIYFGIFKGKSHIHSLGDCIPVGALLVFCYAGGVTSWYFYERHFLAWGHRIKYLNPDPERAAKIDSPTLGKSASSPPKHGETIQTE